MNIANVIRKGTLFITFVVGITACSSKPDIKEFPKSAHTQEEITNLEVALENSRAEETDLLAPVSYKEARLSLKDAKKMEKDGKKKEKVLKEVALGQAYLNRAQKESAENRGKLQDILAARQEAITANANTLLPNEFSKMDKKLKEETAKIEEDKRSKIKEKRSDFIAGYRDLELGAIKKHHLGESKILIDQAVKNGAPKLTPKTFAATKKKYDETDLFITQNRHNKSEIEGRSADVLQQARNLESTTATAMGLAALTPEETALRMQSEEERLNKAQQALAQEHGTKEALAASNIQMAKEKELNAIYEEARGKFTPDEAEVYKQGDNLVIRLRSLEFPTAKAEIQNDKFALLKKVEDVIESFDKSTVVIEGHTDSIGGKQLNKKLSDQRAEAVKKYLEVNTSEKNAEFESMGYGYEKPIASNKTPEGRAQNRRVDIIIEPTKL
ncbi:MAG: OmpA family protein [Bacteriovoracaceae bacterium]|nr:OmpA family protein [Bacteriovoracaceae bacterium]